LINQNVGGGDVKNLDIQYRHEKGGVYVVQFGLEGGYSSGPQGGGRVGGGVTAGTTLTTDTGYMTLRGRQTLAKSGEAFSPAENIIHNRIEVTGSTNDFVVGWEIYTKTVEERLEISEAE